MSKQKMGLIAFGVCAFIGILICSSYSIGVLNQEVDLRTAIENKQKDNMSEFDNMWKKISQSAEISGKHKDSLVEIFTKYAQERKIEGGSLALWIKEAVPTVDFKTFENLQNIIISSRDRWTMRQKELIDIKREHDRLRLRIPSNIVMSLFNRKEISIKVITSEKTKESFNKEEENEISLFSGESK